jgi:hypothetical protein
MFPARAQRLAQAGRDQLRRLGQVIAFMGEPSTLKELLPAPERFVDLQYLRAAGLK